VKPLCSKQFAQFCMLLFLLGGLVHVPGVRGVPQLDDPFILGSAFVLVGTSKSPTLLSFFDSHRPVGFIMCHPLHASHVPAEKVESVVVCPVGATPKHT
jgi:hypothetical protein